MIKIIIFSVLGVIGLLVLLIIGILAFHSITIINNTIDSGEGYGFNIGDSKIESYQIAKKLIEQNEIIGFGYMYAKPIYNQIYSPQEIYKIKKYFHRWDFWLLTGVEELQSNRIDFDFKNGSLNKIRKVGDEDFILLSQWPENSSDNLDVVNVGDSYSLAYKKLEAVSNHYPLVRIQTTIFSSYKLPKHALKNEYYLVEDFNRWNFRVSSHFFSNSIALTFDDHGKLIQIHRKRYALEFP